MSRALYARVLLASLACAVAVAAQAANGWNESLAGDLSNSGRSPTPVAMAVGINRVLGTTGNSGQGIDRDYFTFTVPSGAKLTALNLLSNTAVSGGASFIGIQAGPQVTVTPSGGGVENLIGLGHYSNDQIGTDMLPAVLVGPTVEIGSGTYSVWVQDTGGPASYGFDFVIAATTTAVPSSQVPLPTWSMLGLALALCLAARRYETRQAH